MTGPGAPIGNLNALKHGFYSKKYRPRTAGEAGALPMPEFQEAVALIRHCSNHLAQAGVAVQPDWHATLAILCGLCQAANTLTRLLKAQHWTTLDSDSQLPAPSAPASAGNEALPSAPESHQPPAPLACPAAGIELNYSSVTPAPDTSRPSAVATSPTIVPNYSSACAPDPSRPSAVATSPIIVPNYSSACAPAPEPPLRRCPIANHRFELFLARSTLHLLSPAPAFEFIRSSTASLPAAGATPRSSPFAFHPHPHSNSSVPQPPAS